MYKNIEPFGEHVLADSIGEVWMDSVQAVLDHGDVTFDENRKRFSLQNVRIKINEHKLPDSIIDTYGNKKNIDSMIHMTFKTEEMYDFDVVPSFSPGAKSYHARLKEGRMEEFVVERLSKIPESKKAVISFIHWDDYKAVLDTPYDDYLPCIVTIQFRLLEKDGKYVMTTIFSARSMDIFQKGNGNMIAISMLANRITRALNKKLDKEVVSGAIDGFITDMHIYNECIDDAKNMIAKYNKETVTIKSN